MGTPLRNAASWLPPTAYNDSPSRLLETGIQMIPTMTSSTIAAFGIQAFTNGPITRSSSHGDAAPPGADRTSSAQPAQTKDIASVTTISGTRVMTTSEPLTVPRRTPSRSTATTTPTPNVPL